VSLAELDMTKVASHAKTMLAALCIVATDQRLDPVLGPSGEERLAEAVAAVAFGALTLSHLDASNREDVQTLANILVRVAITAKERLEQAS
jgi:hypothetical protein